MILLGKGNFWFHFRLFIQFLALCSMDKKAEVEPKIAFVKYYHSSSSLGNFLFSIFYCIKFFQTLTKGEVTSSMGINKNKLQNTFLFPCDVLEDG